MIRYFLIFLIFISLNSFSQEFNVPIAEDSFLFTYKDKSYVISGDSVYIDTIKRGWIAKKHNLIINDLVFFQDKNNGYLMHNSGGVIYKFDGNTFSRIDDSFEFNSQYQSFPFIYNNAIYNFGGYGLFTFKNIITYFNKAKKETELVQIKTPISQNPIGRKKMFAQIERNYLFIGPGYGYNTEIIEGNIQSQLINDYWKFDLNTREWKKLGVGITPYMIDDTYHLIYDFNGETLVITGENIFTIDIKNNKITFYDNANNDLLKSNKKDKIRNLITYNKIRNGFYLVLNKPNLKNKLVFVSTKDFLGAPTGSEILYSVKNNKAIYYFVGGLVALLLIFFVAKKKSNIQKITSKRKEINLILTLEEKHIFNLIYDSYPDFVPFPELMDVFESHLSYESRKKKLRASLYQIEDKIKGILKNKVPVFIERKNKEDLRIKEIRIK